MVVLYYELNKVKLLHQTVFLLVTVPSREEVQ